MSEDDSTPVVSGGKVNSLLIEDEMKECYLDYAMSVIVGRALPDVRDGLKPVHRRVLYSMHSLNNYHNKPYMKSARIVGDVIGKYHPHGDSAVYGAVVRLAQDFSMRYPVVDGQGNFGSIDGDNAAAMRYTEIRMKKMAEELLKDLDKETVDWQENYDDSLKEPTVLPAKVPNLLINGSTGIAVGMSTNIPPHNMTEVMTGLIELLKDPTLEVADIMDHIPAPDFPTAGIIHGTMGIKKAYTTGKGVIQIRARADIEVHGKQERERIIITEIPYQVNKAKLIEKIASLVNDKVVTGISDIRDESNRLGIRVVIEIKRGEPANVILNKLFKHTQLQVSFGMILLAIHNGQPKVMNIKQLLQSFIDHRREVVIRRTTYELKKARERAHILEGLKIAVENIDAIVELVKKAESPSVARTKLIKNYSLSEIQAQAILDMKLQRLTGLERDKIISDYEAIMKEIARLEAILDSEDLLKNIIKDEFEEALSAYGDERRTEIVAKADEMQIEDLIKNEEVIVTITHKGYLKRMAIDTYKAQKRGGKGVKGASFEGDFYNSIFTADTHDTMLFFTDKGTVFSLKVYNIPEASRTSKGRNIVNLLPISKDEKVREIVTMPREKEGKFLIIATKNGLIKKTELSEYKNIKQSGLRAIKIVDGDAVVGVNIGDGTKDMFLCASSGKAIRFGGDDIRAQGRVSQGVKGIGLTKEEEVIGFITIDDSDEILTVTDKGFGKRTLANDFRSQSRGGKGTIAMRLTGRNGQIVQLKPVSDKEDLMIISNNGQVIRTKISEISLVGRNTQGVRLINLKSGEKVVAVEKIAESNDEDDE